MWHAPVFVMFSNRILAISRVNWRMYPKKQAFLNIGVHLLHIQIICCTKLMWIWANVPQKL